MFESLLRFSVIPGMSAPNGTDGVTVYNGEEQSAEALRQQLKKSFGSAQTRFTGRNGGTVVEILLPRVSQDGAVLAFVFAGSCLSVAFS
jgi:hypothetical protein